MNSQSITDAKRNRLFTLEDSQNASALKVGAEGELKPPCFVSPPIEIYDNSTPYCTLTMAYGVTCYSFLFFIDTFKPTY